MSVPPSIPQLTGLLRAAPARCGQTKLVSIDGPAGSGKTTLAAALAVALGGTPVVHMDDLYEGWNQPLGDELAARIDTWLLSAWLVGSTGRYRRYDWAREEFAEELTPVPPAPVVILEGCASASQHIRRLCSVVVWVEAPVDLRMQRGLDRDGLSLSAQWRAWQSREAAHFAADATRQSADVLVDGTTGAVMLGGGPR